MIMKIYNTTDEMSANLLADDEDWLTFLDPTLCKAVAVESLTHLLFRKSKQLKVALTGHSKQVPRY